MMEISFDLGTHIGEASRRLKSLYRNMNSTRDYILQLSNTTFIVRDEYKIIKHLHVIR